MRPTLYITTSVQGADQGEILTAALGFNRTLPFYEKEKDPGSPEGKETYLVKTCLTDMHQRFLDNYTAGFSVKTSNDFETLRFRNKK